MGRTKKRRELEALQEQREQRKKWCNEAVDKVIDDNSMAELAKIDAVAKIRGWFAADTKLIDQYMAGSITVGELIEMLAVPIERTYSSADYGTQYYKQEISARQQRKFHDPEKALELWGPEEDFPKPVDTNIPSTELRLWDLYYGILHAAKRIPWNDHEQQEKLLEIIRGLKTRPEPPRPVPMTIPLQRAWIWESGYLWSNLNMLGAAVSEIVNDSPGCASAWTSLEQRAWVNVSSFLARVTRDGLFDLRNVGVSALRDATEANMEEHPNLHHIAPAHVKLEHHVTEASVWLILAGDRLLEDYAHTPDQEAWRIVDEFIELRDKALPWNRSRRKNGNRPRHEDYKLEFFRRRLDIESQNEMLSEEARQLAAQASICVARIADSKTYVFV
jgi:hypothetical protein